MVAMQWTLLIVAISSGLWSAEAKFHSIPMLTKEACVRAAKDAASNSSRHLGYICISSETGESLKFQNEK